MEKIERILMIAEQAGAGEVRIYRDDKKRQMVVVLGHDFMKATEECASKAHLALNNILNLSTPHQSVRACASYDGPPLVRLA